MKRQVAMSLVAVIAVILVVNSGNTDEPASKAKPESFIDFFKVGDRIRLYQRPPLSGYSVQLMSADEFEKEINQRAVRREELNLLSEEAQKSGSAEKKSEYERRRSSFQDRNSSFGTMVQVTGVGRDYIAVTSIDPDVAKDRPNRERIIPVWSLSVIYGWDR